MSIAEHGAEAVRRGFEECIAAGGVALFPADGLYGLACDPMREAAIQRIHAIKGRDDGKPAAVMYFSVGSIRELIAAMPEAVREAAAALLPGPVTLVVPNPQRRYPLACRADPEKLGVRLIEGPLAGARQPVFQTSANRSGEPAPATFADLAPEIVAAVDLAIDGGELTGLPSTVVDLTEWVTQSRWRVLREGAMDRAAIAARLGPGNGGSGGGEN